MIHLPKNNALIRGAAPIQTIALLIGAILVALILGSYVAQGSLLEAYIILIATVGLVLLKALKSSFWILLPLTMTSDLPAISVIFASLKLGELWILSSVVFVGIYWFAERRKLKLHLGSAMPMYVYAAWAVVIFILNPVGLLIAGGSAGGGRFYMTIGLAWIAFFIIANVDIREKEAKTLLKFLVIGVLLETGFKLAGAVFPQISYLTAKGTIGSEGFYSWAQLLALPPGLIIPMIFARFSLRDLIHPRNFKYLVVLGLLLLMVFLSGKRSLAVLTLAYPALAAILRRQYGSALALGATAGLGFACLVMLHFSGVSLPKSTQRIIAVVPEIEGLDYEVQNSAANDFRETINRYAWIDIKNRPLIGEGFKVDFERLYLIDNRPDIALERGDHTAGVRASETSSWHNTWLGIAADFGVIGLFFWVLVWIFFLKKAFWLLRILDRNDVRWTLVATLTLIVLGSILRSWQFGHSALNYWSISWQFGVLLGIENWLRSPLRQEAEAAAQKAELPG